MHAGDEGRVPKSGNTGYELLWLRYLPVVAVIIGLYGFKSAWLAMLLYHAGLIVGIAQHRSRLSQLNWGTSTIALWVCLILGLVAGPLVYYALPLLTSGSVGEAMASQLVALGLEGWGLYAFAIYFVLIHPSLEELGWRGILFFQGVRLHYTDLEFVAYHLLVIYWLFPGNWLLLIVAFLVLVVSGWSWRQLRDRVGFKSAIAFHAASDLAVLVAAGKLAGVIPAI